MVDRKGAGQIKISGSLIARNALLKLIGQAAPLLIAVIVIPFIVRRQGTERFKLLLLAWCSGLFRHFGLRWGWATTNKRMY